MRIQTLPPCKQNFFALAWPCGAEHIRTAPISVFPQGNTVSICILHANCQGGPLTRLLRLSPAFSRRWDILHITNYDRSPVPSDALEHCSLFLYQHLGPQWGDLASENLLSRLPRNAVSLCLPNLFFMGYWPFWTSDSSMNFGDICLDYLTDKGLSPAEILHVCLHGRLVPSAISRNASTNREPIRNRRTAMQSSLWKISSMRTGRKSSFLPR